MLQAALNSSARAWRRPGPRQAEREGNRAHVAALSFGLRANSGGTPPPSSRTSTTTERREPAGSWFIRGRRVVQALGRPVQLLDADRLLSLAITSTE